MISHQIKIKTYLKEKGGASADDLCKFLEVTPSTLSRQMGHCRDWVIRLGAARSTRYYAVRKILRNEHRWPIYRILENGEMVEGGILTSLYPNHWHFKASKALSLFNKKEFSMGIYPGLPWFLENMRPQGFLGRSFVKQYASQLRIGADSRLWSSEELLFALLSHGVDCQGNLIVGEEAATIYQSQRQNPKPLPSLESRTLLYPDLAQSVLLGNSVGSSAGGEQQKFTATLSASSGVRHVIVKFSAPLDTHAGRRWADLLLCEHLASKVLHENHIPAAQTEIIEAGGRLFLESTRFDRSGHHGRMGLYSCLPFDAAYYGDLDHWRSFADRIEPDQWLSMQDTRCLRLLHAFGTMIGNNDMHFGNISFLQEDSGRLRLAPSYDMLPMLYAPSTTGEIIERDFSVIPPPPSGYEIWNRALPIAKSFWERVQANPLISHSFREKIADNAQKLKRQ